MNTTKIKLVQKTYSTDSIGQKIALEEIHEVFADVMSITAKEFANAGILGLKPKYEFRVWLAEYNNEEFVDYNGKRFKVYRTYAQGNGRIELYVEEVQV